MSASEKIFHHIINQLTDTSEGKMFGASCIKATNGKTAAILWKGNMLFKLDENSIQEALKLDGSSIGSHLYAPEKPMKGWVSLPPEHSEKWIDFTKKAIAFVKSQQRTNLKDHWDKVYTNNPDEKLGWYETDLMPTLNLISKTGLPESAGILIVGAGSTTLVDELLTAGFTNLTATDISKVALKRLQKRVGKEKVKYISDDLTQPKKLNSLEPVDLWIDRAVLHFFTVEKDRDNYFELLKTKVKSNGFVLFAEFNLNGAEKCSGLPVHRYDKEMLAEKLGSDFKLLDSFDYNYVMPSGAERPYVYALFRKKEK